MNVEQEIGDSGPWIRHLKTAWQAAASTGDDIATPPNPREPVRSGWSTSDVKADVIAYWAPLLQLVHFGLGWPRPDAGLAKWRAAGFPAADPVLRTVLRWWGQQGVVDFLAWAVARGGLGGASTWFADRSPHRQFADDRLTPRDDDVTRRRRDAGEWSSVWGGGSDSLHLLPHALVAVQNPSFPVERMIDPASGNAALMLPVYAGWYLALTDGFDHDPRTVDVVVRPVGWLGTFRRSTKTGLWHRTDEFTHLWGCRP